MKKSLLLVGVLAVALLAGGAFYLGRSTGHAPNGTPTASDGRKVLYWHDPMVPGPRFDKPGKSPFMDMQLVPVYADSATGSGGVKISPTVQQNLGIRLASVRRAELASSVDAIGSVQFDERRSVAVQTRVAGYVERLSVRAPMERVRQGQALATVYAPEWLAPLNELLALQRSGAAPELVAAARERMRALSIPPELVRLSEKAGSAQARFVLSAPVGGVVAELGVREGAAVTPGTTLFRIAGLDKVWALAEVPEAQALLLAPGQKAKAVLQADPSQSFEGELKEILPEVSATSRTLKARFELDNGEGRLIPGMLLRLRIEGAKGMRLLLPSEAVIRTGQRVVVVVRKDDGAFEPREVTLGAEQGEDIEIAQGVAEGEHVVASGQFLIDSEARLRSVLGSMSGGTAAGPSHRAQGRVEGVERDGLTISHEPVASLRWPAMTMGFSKPSPDAFAGIKVGDAITFEFKEGGPMGYELLSVQRMQPQPGEKKP
ncbi:MAG TPA: efflux RND transporter periplasmic adaptor subunit [Variovorax sp.]|nr:efflux RND transporter periplasmic adaptor subunit [Variovorax sp.]